MGLSVVAAGIHGRIVVTILGLPVLMASPLGQTEPPLTPSEGLLLEPKLAQISSHPTSASNDAGPVVLYQREVNAYLRFQAAPALPTGVTDPYLSFGMNGQITAYASVDLSAVSASQTRGALDPLAYLSGTVPVAASGAFHTENGQGRLEIDSVTVGGIPVPLSVLHELIRHYSRNETQPDGVDLSGPFALPYEVTEVQIDPGRASVFQ